MPSGLKVLVVDDNPGVAELIRDAVEDLGNLALACFSGVEALQLVGRFRPDVILLDLDMPGTSGVDVARALRGDRRFDRMKIIAQTAHGTAEDRRSTASAGFDLHLAKPISLSMLDDMLSLLKVK
jgi:CheY-like chemotaxis protein